VNSQKHIRSKPQDPSQDNQDPHTAAGWWPLTP